MTSSASLKSLQNMNLILGYCSSISLILLRRYDDFILRFFQRLVGIPELTGNSSRRENGKEHTKLIGADENKFRHHVEDLNSQTISKAG